MKSRIRIVVPALFAVCVWASPLLADGLSCESSPAVLAVQRDGEHELETATFAQALALREATYLRLMKLDASDYRPSRDYLSDLRYDQPEKFNALRDKAAQEHPETPVEMLAQEMLLAGKDTPHAFRVMEELAAQQPDYAPTYIQQAGLYERAGKYADKDKAARAIEKFYQLCPESIDWRPMGYLKQFGSNELKTTVARNLRTRLAGSTDPYVLPFYAQVWSLEFAVLPIVEHPQERQKVAGDLSRLQKLAIPPTAEWLDFLTKGYKQSGASEAQVKALEDRILKEFPHSDEAFSVSYNNWKEQHPEPAGEASAAEWQQYMRLAVTHYNELSQQFPQEHGFGYYSVEYGPYLDGTSANDIMRAGEAYIHSSDLYEGISFNPRDSVGTVFTQKNIQPARALALLDEARQLKDSPRDKAMFELTDYAKPKEVEDAAKNLASRNTDFNVDYLRACRAAADKAAAERLKDVVEAAPPTNAELLARYWNARALLAEMEDHTLDALAFYQKALFTREPPKPRYGKLDDVLLTDARHLWTATNGSEAAFALWSQPDKSAKAALAEGRWEKPDKELPAFELADLQGKTWKLTALEGKKVLINVWATWCGPCQSELPRLQKLYEDTKGRSDIAIITLNMDSEQGMIEPFVKKKGFTFPVLPAYSFLENKIDVDSIPRNWLLGGNGKWLWEQIGFDSAEADWGKSMLARLEEMR